MNRAIIINAIEFCEARWAECPPFDWILFFTVRLGLRGAWNVFLCVVQCAYQVLLKSIYCTIHYYDTAVPVCTCVVITMHVYSYCCWRKKSISPLHMYCFLFFLRFTTIQSFIWFVCSGLLIHYMMRKDWCRRGFLKWMPQVVDIM